MRKRRSEKVLRPIWPNAGIETEYRRKIARLLADIHNSVLYWTRAAYRANEPRVAQLAAELAQDETPAEALARIWQGRFKWWYETIDETAERLARWFAKAAMRRSDGALEKALRDAGMAVEFRLTRTQRDALKAIVEENVSLIKSIPHRYLEQVEQVVMRSVSTGRDLKYLTDEIVGRYQVTRKRAAFIARDQNNKATSALQRVRRMELGLDTAVWLHSHAGKQPRKTHVEMNGKKFDIAKGMWDSHEKMWIQPGFLINCRCTSRAVVPGLT